MPPTVLTLVSSPDAVRDSVATFNIEAHANRDRALDVLAATTYWVHNPSTSTFGPSKFVGFERMDFKRYESALSGATGDARFNGNVTRRAIERATKSQYGKSGALTTALRTWGENLLGPDAFGKAEQGKWLFLNLDSTATRNPPWQRDELILALDLYVRLGRVVGDDTAPEVVTLSGLLNQLPIHAARPDAVRFRNPNGVALKLANFRAIDQPGRGMSRGNKLDRVVWEEFSGDEKRLRAVAEVISTGYRRPDATPVLALTADEESEFPEGRVVYRLHRARERNGQVIAKKKAQVLQQHGRLACEACGFDFAMTYGPVGMGYIECHHVVALETVASSTVTHLQDLMLLCANCHRIVHRKRPWLRAEQIRTMIVAPSASSAL
jgi:5-methylcytosine-specific restriction protein A